MADNAKWYVIHTYSGYENAVKAAIEKSVVNRNMSDMVLKMEIPMETVTEVTESGVMKEVERKVFPGYVLIKMILTDDTWHLIRNIRGVTGFLGQLLDEQNVAFRDLILLSAGLNDCMHCSCTSFLYHGLAVGGEARRKTVCPAHACL